MCTASWSVGVGQATLVFNRDERKLRQRARPPTVFERNGVRRIAPIDPESGGTWIASNEFGLCCFLLNNYEAIQSAPSIENPQSRGILPLILTDSKEMKFGVQILKGLDLTQFPPFHIVLLSVETVRVFTWNGMDLQERDAGCGLLTSSSYRSSAVQAYRKERYEELLGNIENISLEKRREYHVELHNEDRAFNPFMLREESETHNICSLEMKPNELVFSYEERVSETFDLLEPQLSKLSCH